MVQLPTHAIPTCPTCGDYCVERFDDDARLYYCESCDDVVEQPEWEAPTP